MVIERTGALKSHGPAYCSAAGISCVLTANHLVEQSWSLICAFFVESLVPLHPHTEMTLQTASFVSDCPQNIRDPPGHVLKMSAKQYYTPQSVTNSQGLVLLFSHCIGARGWIFAHLTMIDIELTTSRQGAMGADDRADFRAETFSGARSMGVRLADSRRVCDSESPIIGNEPKSGIWRLCVAALYLCSRTLNFLSGI